MIRAVLVIFSVLLTCTAPLAETFSDKAREDKTISVSDEDPVMNAAFAKARQTLPGFLKLLDAPPAEASDLAVKLKVVEGQKTEFFWANHLRREGSGFTADINNDPEIVHNVTNGQTMHFRQDEIYDWMYWVGGTIKGNFTASALLSHGPAEEAAAFKAEYGLVCD